MDTRIGIVCSILFFLGCHSGFSQELEETIPWESGKRLVWSDFKGPIPPDASAAATTASGISYSYSANLWHHEVNLDFEVKTFFYPNESWYKPYLCDDVVLSHEQLHFDIAELFARKMRLKLERTSFTKNVKQEIKKIYQETLKELSDFQELYDWETNFSRNREGQAKWNARIAEALKSTSY